MKEIKGLLTKLINREITPYECMNKLNHCNNRDLEQLVSINKIPVKTRKGLTLNDVGTMNFTEVREYCKAKANKGINLNDLAIELDIKWENGEISGFDYRYFKESAGIKITKEFINSAKKIGRYDKWYLFYRRLNIRKSKLYIY